MILILNSKIRISYKIASINVKKIKEDIYPNLNGYGSKDKKYLENPNKAVIILGEK